MAKVKTKLHIGLPTYQATVLKYLESVFDSNSMTMKLNPRNIIHAAIEFRKDHGMQTTTLSELFNCMISSGYESVKYLTKIMNSKPDYESRPEQRRGNSRVHYYLQKDFEFRLGVISEFDMGWWIPPAKRPRPYLKNLNKICLRPQPLQPKP